MVILLRKRAVVSTLCVGVIIAATAVYAFFATGDKPAVSPEKIPTSVILVLDAGHGGEDGGAVSSSGVPESDINLQIVRKLELLFTFVGESTLLTRDGEEAIYSPDAQSLREKKVSDLNNRVDLVNSTAGSFLISIHQNSLPGSNVRGAQVFFNKTDPAEFVAAAVQQALNGSINSGNSKNAKQIEDSIFLMKNIRSPGILVECGFMSNSGEVRLLQTPAHQCRISAAIASGYLQCRMENQIP